MKVRKQLLLLIEQCCSCVVELFSMTDGGYPSFWPMVVRFKQLSKPSSWMNARLVIGTNEHKGGPIEHT